MWKGEEKVNYPKLLHIRVTEEDIEMARQAAKDGLNREKHCPIAQSVMRQGYDRVEVDTVSLIIGEYFTGIRYHIPRTAREFIREADRSNDHVTPYKFIALRTTDVPVE